LQILAMLLERRCEVVTRDQVRAALWPSDVYVDFDRGLNKAMVKLREAIDDSATAPRFIETLPKIGYRFIASETPQPMVVPARRRIALVPLLAIALALLAIVSAVVVLRPRPTAIRSLAVLPLDDLSGDPSQAYFADGMTDELITAIAQIGERHLPHFGHAIQVDAEDRSRDRQGAGRRRGAGRFGPAGRKPRAHLRTFWRPVTAIRAGGGNENLIADPSWTPLGVTPKVGATLPPLRT
jgi:hypothetical protein